MRRFALAIVISGLIAIGCNSASVQASEPNRLALDVPGSVCVKPGSEILIDMDVSNLLQPVSSLQAFLSFSSTYFLAGSGDVTIAPGGGGVWEELIWNAWNTQGDLDVAVGLKLDGPASTSADGTVAKVTLKSRSGVEGATRVVFRPDADPDPGLVGSTILGAISGDAVWPSKSDSPIIIIDGTAPDIDITSVRQNGQEFIGTSSRFVAGTVYVVVSAADPIHGGVASGLAGHPALSIHHSDGTTVQATYVNESPSGSFNYTWTVLPTTPNGTATLTASVSDKSGNTSTDALSFIVNTNTITGTVAMDTFSGEVYQFDRTVAFKATNISGALLQSWLVTVRFVNNKSTKIASGTYVLADVPGATVRLSAKTDWSLRRRLAVTLVSGSAALPFTGTAKLLGGDLTGDNKVTIPDYSILLTNYFMPVAAADINGDGIVTNPDYVIMRTYWFAFGDPI